MTSPSGLGWQDHQSSRGGELPRRRQAQPESSQRRHTRRPPPPPDHGQPLPRDGEQLETTRIPVVGPQPETTRIPVLGRQPETARIPLVDQQPETTRIPVLGRSPEPGVPPKGTDAPGGGRTFRGIAIGPARIKATYADALPPKQVHRAFVALLGGLAVNVLHALVGVVLNATLFSVLATYGYTAFSVGAALTDMVIWLVASVVALLVAVQMRAGANWARIVIAVLGGIAALFGLIGIFGAFAYLAFSGVYGLVGMVFSVVSTALLVVAIALMFRSGVKGYFH